jgi:hypothetical protein
MLWKPIYVMPCIGKLTEEKYSKRIYGFPIGLE